jgi:hypothetical protein
MSQNGTSSMSLNRWLRSEVNLWSRHGIDMAARWAMMFHGIASIGDVRANPPVGSSGVTRCRRKLREVEGQQVDDIGIRFALRYSVSTWTRHA